MQKLTLMMHPNFLERAASLQKNTKSKLVKILWLLSTNVNHPGLQTKKVRGSHANVYECRVDRGIRLIYDACAGCLRCWYVGEHDSALEFAQSFTPLQSQITVDDIRVQHDVKDRDIAGIVLFLVTGRIAHEFVTTDVEELKAYISC